MRNLIQENRTFVLALLLAVVAVLAAPALAGTYYTWTTDDGTVAFTDDKKRIPARYKDAAKRKTVGRLKDYPRYTESKVKQEMPYGERLEARLEAFREVGDPDGDGLIGPAHVSAGPPGVALRIDGSSTRTEVAVPTGEDEPVIVEEHRVRLRDSIATQDVTVSRQGDKVISVQRSKRNEGRISERGSYDPEAVR